MKTALYTTIYPGVEPFLEAWKESVINQVDSDFEVWVGVDELSLNQAEELFSGLKVKKFILNECSGSKATIRKKALKEIVDLYDAVVLVDSDDLLYETRVSSARAQLADYDVTGCAMDLMDVSGRRLNMRFGRNDSKFSPNDIIEFNQFGLSNTAYRTAVLKQCLDLPDECELFDWLLIMNAWSLDSLIYFDPIQRMQYRQYADNTAKVVLPFTSEEVQFASDCVLKHFSYAMEISKTWSDAKRQMIKDRKNSVLKFSERFSKDENFSKKYTQQFNAMSQDNLWWSCVANRSLEALWK